MTDQAFDALKTYEWGVDPKTLGPITEAVVASHGDAAARKDLETRLVEALSSEVPRAAKDYVCRQLHSIGTAAAVPALAKLLADKELSHMGRYALERIPAPEAGAALREALGKVDGKLKIGVISSLATRREAASVAPLAALLKSDDAAVARSAVQALGFIGTAEAAKALRAGVTDKTKVPVADALLVCAEQALADGNKAEALAIYKGLAMDDQPKHVRVAATRGVLACTGK